jgi:hypothetical protein
MTEKLMEKFIIENYLHFDPVVFLETTAKSLTRDAACDCFEKVVESIASDTSNPYNIVKWCMNIKENNYEACKLYLSYSSIY